MWTPVYDICIPAYDHALSNKCLGAKMSVRTYKYTNINTIVHIYTYMHRYLNPDYTGHFKMGRNWTLPLSILIDVTLNAP